MRKLKIEPGPDFFVMDEGFGGSVKVRMSQREVVFIFQHAKISDANFRLSVQRPLLLQFCAKVTFSNE